MTEIIKRRSKVIGNIAKKIINKSTIPTLLCKTFIGLGLIMGLSGIGQSACTQNGPATYTTKAGIKQPAINNCNWGTDLNADMSIIDSSFGALGSANTWISTQTHQAPIVMQNKAIQFGDTTSHYVSFQASPTVTTTVFTLPAADGSNGQALVTNGNAVLSFQSTGGGASVLGINQSAVSISSPTSAINFIGPPFLVSLVGGSTAQVTLNASSVTLQGNIFNQASKLVQLDGSARLPAVDGSQLTNLPSSSGGSSSLQVTLSGVQITSPTASLNFFANDFKLQGNGSTSTIALNPATTDFIQNTSVLQSGSVFFVSSGTINGNLNLNGGFSTVQIKPATSSANDSIIYFSTGSTPLDFTEGNNGVGGVKVVSILGPTSTSNSINGISKPALYVSGNLGIASSATVLGAGGLNVTYGTISGSGTFTTSLTVAGQNVCQANGTNCPSSGGGGSSALQVTQSGVQITSPTASINFYGGDFGLLAIGSTSTVLLNPKTTDFIQATSALQTGSTFYVSSGTVLGLLTASTATIAGQLNVGGPIVGNGAYLQNVAIMSPNATAPFIDPTPGSLDISQFYNTPSASSGGGYKISGTLTLNRSGNTLVVGSNNAGSSSGSTCVGDSACGHLGSSATHSTVIGNAALNADVSGEENTVAGYQAGFNATTNRLAFFGAFAGSGNTSGNQNVAVGWDAMPVNDTGFSNTCIGNDSCDLLKGGYENTIVGNVSGADITTGVRNVCLGSGTGAVQPCTGIITGSSNTAVGNGSLGNTSFTGNEKANTAIGFFASVAQNVNESVAIGYNAVAPSSFTMQLGGTGVDALRVIASTITVSSMSVTSLASGQCVQTGAGGLLTVTGSACGSGGGVATTAFSTITVTNANTGSFSAEIITSTGTGIPLQIIGQGSPGGGVQQKQGYVTIGDDTVGKPIAAELVIVSSRTDAQVGAGHIELWADGVGDNDPMYWEHRVSNNSAPDLRIDAPAPNMEVISISSSGATNGRGKFEPWAIPFQSEILQVNSRSWDNTTFENMAYWEPLDIQPGFATPGLFLQAQSLANDSGILVSSNTSGVNFFTQNNHTIGITGPLNVASGSWRIRLPSSIPINGQILGVGGADAFGDYPSSWTFNLPSGSVNYIQNTSTLQSGATFYLSSGTVQNLKVATISGGGGGAVNPLSDINVNSFLAMNSFLSMQSGNQLQFCDPTNATCFGMTSDAINHLLVNSVAGTTFVYGVQAGSITLGNVASGTQCLHADSSGNVTGTGSDCGSGGGGITALTGDVTASGSGSVAATAAALQNNITTFGSSITVTNTLGIKNNFGITTSSISVSSITAGGTIVANKFTIGNLGLNNTGIFFQNGQDLTNTSAFEWNGTTMSATKITASTITATTQLNVTGALGENVAYQLVVGSMTGAGLTSCSGATNALSWNNSTNLFGCNTITGGGGSTSGNINAAAQFSAPYYSLSGTTTTLSAFPYMTLSTNTINAINITSNTVITSSNASNAFAVTANGGNYGTNTPNGAGAEIDCSNTGTNGNCFQIYSHQGTQNQLDAAMSIVLDSSTYNERAIYIQQNGAANSPVNGIRMDMNDYATMTFEDTKRNSNGINGIYQFSDHNDALRIERRISGSFENGLSVAASTAPGIVAINNDYGVPQSTLEVAGNLSVGEINEGVPAPLHGMQVQGLSNFQSSITVIGTELITGSPAPGDFLLSISSSSLAPTTTAYYVDTFGDMGLTGAISYLGINSKNIATYVVTSTDSIVASSCPANTSITNTLPASSTNKGHDILIAKVDVSTQVVTIKTNGTDLIGGTTNILQLVAPGQSAELVADGVSNWILKKIPAYLPFIGNDSAYGPQSAAAVSTSSDTHCQAFTVPDYQAAQGTAFTVGTPNGKMDVGIYQVNQAGVGTLLASAGATAMPSNNASLNYTSAAYLSPGILYYKCAAISNTTGTLDRYAPDATWNTCQFSGTNVPLPSSLTFSACTTSGRLFVQTIKTFTGSKQ